MKENNNPSTPQETSVIALSGMILSIVGLICSFMAHWRIIGMVIALIALIISAFSIYKANQTGVKKLRAIAGIIFSMIAILVAVYFLYVRPAKNMSPENEIPVELKDTIEESDHNNAMEKLQGLTDSTHKE